MSGGVIAASAAACCTSTTGLPLPARRGSRSGRSVATTNSAATQSVHACANRAARNLDIAIVISGDGDFAPAIRAVQEMGVRCEVISFRGNTSSDLIEVADQFTDIIQLARVEKGSRSGRRVAEDDADLSMTEVPDKLTEGTGSGRGGRSRGRRFRDEEPAAAGARGRRER